MTAFLHRRRKSSTAALVALAGALALAGCQASVVAGAGHASTGGHASTASASAAAASSGSSTAQTSSPPASSSPSPAGFAAVYSRQRSGVVRIDVLGCSEGGVGTGFLLSPTLVVTVAHVVNAAVVVSLVDGSQRTTGTVIGIDNANDLALVRARQPIDGYHFQFSAAGPRVGDVVAAIGFPIRGPITLTQGGVSGLHRSIRVEGQPRHNMIETDAAVNPGNSGGPLLEPDGTVIGLVDALDTAANGIAYAVPATQATSEVASWRAGPAPIPAADCDTPLGPRPAAPPIQRIPNLSASASAGISGALSRYFRGINSGNYRAAYRVFSPALRSQSSEQSFADGDSTSYDFDQAILDAKQLSPREATVALSFTSLQAPDKGPDHDSCDVWSISYDMVEQNYSWYINGTSPYGPTTHTSC